MKTLGLIAAPPTAFCADGAIDLAAVAPLAGHLQRQGVAGVFVNGTTGEGLSLTVEEREQLAAEWRRVLPADVRLFVHTGHHALCDSQRLTRHACAIGADAAAVIAPGFYKPAGAAGVADWCAAIAAEAPDLPFYFYHFPAMNGVQLSIADLLSRAAERIPNLAGVKFTHEDLGDYLLARQVADGRFDLLWGHDDMLLGALATGAEGAVGSTFNVIAPLYRRLIAAFQLGDLPRARACQAQAVTFINILNATGSFLSALKAVLRTQGVPITQNVRLPLAPVDEETLTKICVPAENDIML